MAFPSAKVPVSVLAPDADDRQVPSPAPLRRARPGEAAEIAAVYVASRRSALPYLPELHDAAETEAWIGTQIRDAEVWVAEHEGRIVALMVVREHELYLLFVAPGHHGRGIGSRLLRLAQSQRPDGLTLWTFQRNHRARSFYERRGFRPVEFTDGDNEEREPDVRYQWSGVPGRGTP